MMGLTLAERRAVTETIAIRYSLANKRTKGIILDELCATTGWHRNHARKALTTALEPHIGIGEKSAASEVRAGCHCRTDCTGTRVLAEIGDERTRFGDARALKAYAGPAPVTRASGRSISITHRHIKNNRLANAGWMWMFSAVSAYEPAHKGQRREHATETPQPPDTCSTNSSASSTTACSTTKGSMN
jgi:hypothetical protein